MSDIVIRYDGDTRQFSAHVPDVPACGTGETEQQAIFRLCSLLGDFVRGHARTIDSLRVDLDRTTIEYAQLRGTKPGAHPHCDARVLHAPGTCR
jgi:hypothetical protein